MTESDTTIVSRRLYFTYSYNLFKTVLYVWMKKFLNGHRPIRTVLDIIAADNASGTTT